MADTREVAVEATPERAYRAAVAAVSELGYSIQHSDPVARTVSFNTGVSMRTWGGQDMTVPGQ